MMRWLLLLCTLLCSVSFAQDDGAELPTFDAMTEAPYGKPPPPEQVDDLAREVSSISHANASAVSHG